MNYEDRVTKEYIEDTLGSCAKIATGTYTGTGGYGASNPTTLTLPFVPKLLFVLMGGNSFLNQYFGILSYPATNLATAGTVGSGTKNYASWSNSGKTVSWYNDGGPGPQLNVANTTYYWVAIA